MTPARSEKAQLMSTALPLPPPASLPSDRERELATRFAAAEARLIRAAASLIRRAEDASVKRIILAAANEVSPMNDDSPIHDIVPFWDDLSQSSQHKVRTIIESAGERALGGNGGGAAT